MTTNEIKPMKKLLIQLNQDYKSFKSGFEVSLDGNLIILSGINGSGKSQLIDIIRQPWPNDPKKAIKAIIKIDNEEVKIKDIIYRSFKENINLAEIPKVGAQNIKGYKDQVWNAYHNYRLDSNRNELEQFQKSSKEAKEILLKTFSKEKFNNGEITQEDIENTDFGDFIWRSDDPFTTVIGDLFLAYAIKVQNEKLKYSDTIESFDSSLLDTPPWIRLNDLFAKLRLEYRFKEGREDYFIRSDLQLNELPKLYQLKENGDIDKNDSRNLNDLSDGEKAIILLIFASFSNTNFKQKKILLLDEFDATFNPSLVKAFYELIDKYFVSKNILVVIATHSPATISLAPEHTSFYEVFSKTRSSQRILSVQKDDYNELRIANKNFYTDISNQASRILKLEEENKTKKEEIDQLSRYHNPNKIFICEDENGVEIWKKLFEKFGITDIDVIPSKGCTNDNVENWIELNIQKNTEYMPTVFRSLDRDGYTDQQVGFLEQFLTSKKKDKSKVNEDNYKLKFLPVSEIENFAVLAEKFFDDFDFSSHQGKLNIEFSKTANTNLWSLSNIIDNKDDLFGTHKDNEAQKEEMRSRAMKNVKKFFPGKEIKKLKSNFDVKDFLIKLPVENYPNELKDYLNEIKTFFNNSEE